MKSKNKARTFSLKLNRRLKSTYALKNPLGDVFPDLPWYGWWLRDQLMLQPASLFDCLPGFDCESEECLTGTFLPLCMKISDIMRQGDGVTLTSITDSLVEDGIVNVGNEEQALESVTTLVFAVVGWLTMLYRPDVLSCPPDEFSIVDETNGYRGWSHMVIKQDRRRASNKHISRLLLAFGMMLPPPNYNSLSDNEEVKLYDKLKSIDPSTLNLFLLTSIGAVSVHWTDSLACHLELDTDAKIVYVFRYPSFCLSNLGKPEDNHGVLRSCGTEVLDSLPCGTEEDIVELLGEVLISYRLLFGQNMRSRRLFQKLTPFMDIPMRRRDDMLVRLCIDKEFDLAPGLIKQRDVYEMARDFPHLRCKLVRLSHHLSQRKPRSWVELWVDNRDSASWLTFWAVIIIGGVGLLLAFIQVALQVVQVAYQFQHPEG
ncbi:hypothetical protein GGS20DRAFT_590594 [Poronia punctata]|nr:hypothetical protein GGS20DRAFT_590594 [Poronia punctata]